MRDNIISTSAIGLAQDFSELFKSIRKANTSSDNWFQQYQLIQDSNRILLREVENLISTSLELYQREWSTFSTKSKVVPLSNEDFVVKYKEPLYQSIVKSPINNGEESDSTVMFSKLLNQNKISTLHIINELFINNVDNENICVKILSLCNDYTYNELFPTAQTLASLSINHKSDRVKSAAMNLFSHWGTIESYNLLCSIECPNEPWIVLKYNTIKNSLEKKWCMQEK